MGSTICFLTISNFLGSQLKALPRIGADAAWLLQFMLSSLIFTFYAVVEYILCNYLFRVEQRVDKTRELAIEEKKARIKRISLQRFNSIQELSISTGVIPTNNGCSNTTTSTSQHQVAPTNNNNVIFDDNVVTVNKDDMLQIGLFKIDRLIVKRDGRMLFKDQHIEIFSRYAYPITYIILCLVLAYQHG